MAMLSQICASKYQMWTCNIKLFTAAIHTFS
jgi:hypothetical protein